MATRNSSPQKKLSFHCILKDRLGNIINSSYNHEVSGPHSNNNLPFSLPSSLSALEAELQSLQNSQSKSIDATLEPIALHPDELKMLGLPRPFQPKILKSLWKQIQNLQAGDKKRILLFAEEAYGLYDSSLTLTVPRMKIPLGKEIQVGDHVMTENFPGDMRIYRVTQADAQKLSLDANHPLAGQDLIFEVEVTESIELSPSTPLKKSSTNQLKQKQFYWIDPHKTIH